MEVKTTGFVLPHPIPELGGRLGLYSYEIADSLGVNHSHVLAKARSPTLREHYAKHGWSIDVIASIPARRKTKDSGGRPSKPLAFCLDAAKAFVAKWDNEIGMAYLKHLLTCEKVAEKVGAAPSLSDGFLAGLLDKLTDRSVEHAQRLDAVAVEVQNVKKAIRRTADVMQADMVKIQKALEWVRQVRRLTQLLLQPIRCFLNPIHDALQRSAPWGGPVVPR